MAVTPDASCDIRIGTSGFDYPEWEGPFYPRGIGRKAYLGFYGSQFGTLELNFSYYGMPKAANIRELLGRARPGMDFSIKAHRSLTHQVDAAWKDRATEFREGIEPLLVSGRLCAVLLSFPHSFHRRDEERRYLDRLVAFLAPLPLVVEFRNAEWFTARVIEGLKERRVGLCAVDLPRLEGLPPPADLVTSELAYVRFHGRNAESWWKGDASSRYEYRYPRSELASWIPRLEAMSVEARKLRVFFNNHPRADAPANAKDLAELATAAKLL